MKQVFFIAILLFGISEYLFAQTLHAPIVRNDLGGRHAVVQQAFLYKESSSLKVAIHLQNKSNTRGFHAISRVNFYSPKGELIYFIDCPCLGLNAHIGERSHRNETYFYEIPQYVSNSTASISVIGRKVSKGPGSGTKAALMKATGALISHLYSK